MKALTKVFHRKTIGGWLLLLATVTALIWANSPWSASYSALSETEIGPAALHLNLTVTAWISDGLLAVFFLLAGLELKHELRYGSLSSLNRAALPALTAAMGVAFPAIIYALITWNTVEARAGWAIPTATDIAFTLALLTIVGGKLPPTARAFLLALAIVDDLIAIVIIAIFYSHGLDWGYLALAIVAVASFRLCTKLPGHWQWLLLPIGVTVWYFIHQSGIHATIAGVLIAAVIPLNSHPIPASGEHTPALRAPSLDKRLAHSLEPFSAYLVLPLFALFSAGVTLADPRTALTHPVFWGVLLGLVVGKPLGILIGVALGHYAFKIPLPQGNNWRDIGSLGMLSGIGFTVSLLITQLALGSDTIASSGKLGVLLGSLVAGALAAVILITRKPHHAHTTTDAI